MHYVYFLRSSDNKLYIGQTNDLDRRIDEHMSQLAKCAKFTKEHQGFRLVYQEEYLTRLEAMRREKQLKGWSRAKKEALVSGNFELLKKL